ncbi:hypothetical protein EV13_0117 [Prochlorococcus sp. MIT 0702]|nr:hypothetical protein EV12_0370 [Prochlorococcus sp. MIT 0701]KGG30612.1 hypothetical protein EV13_0117 [Prochlorococcus sp. MIT 0702]KGG36666.1 hypothetical protein EV14_0222 [Prochlorococcus sp. MIT 0703]
MKTLGRPQWNEDCGEWRSRVITDRAYAKPNPMARWQKRPP